MSFLGLLNSFNSFGSPRVPDILGDPKGGQRARRAHRARGVQRGRRVQRIRGAQAAHREQRSVGRHLRIRPTADLSSFLKLFRVSGFSWGFGFFEHGEDKEPGLLRELWQPKELRGPPLAPRVANVDKSGPRVAKPTRVFKAQPIQIQSFPTQL